MIPETGERKEDTESAINGEFLRIGRRGNGCYIERETDNADWIMLNGNAENTRQNKEKKENR